MCVSERERERSGRYRGYKSEVRRRDQDGWRGGEVAGRDSGQSVAADNRLQASKMTSP